MADARTLNARGLSALEAGEAGKAVNHFKAAVAVDPGAPPLWMNLAKAHRAAADDDAERAALEQVLEIDQLHLMANIRLAELHERRSEHGAATDHWARVLALCTQIPNPSPELLALVRHAQAYVDERRESLARAVEAGLAQDLDEASERDRRRARAAADVMLGRRQVYSNQCHGFFYPFLPADEFFDREHFPWLDRLEAATPAIREELQAILASPDPGPRALHRSCRRARRTICGVNSTSQPTGARCTCGGMGPGSTRCASGRRKTAALVELLPLARIPGRAPAVFFSILKAGKRIPPHSGVTNIRTIVHLPLIVPEGCGFRVGGEVREWREGEAFAFDDTIEHEAWNNSAEDRALLILDCWNPHLSEDERRMILKLFAISEAQRPDRPVRG